MPRKLSIIGDLFMLSIMFEQAIRERCHRFSIDIRKHDLQWPDVPMEHGYAVQGIAGSFGRISSGLADLPGVETVAQGSEPAGPGFQAPAFRS